MCVCLCACDLLRGQAYATVGAGSLILQCPGQAGRKEKANAVPAVASCP